MKTTKALKSKRPLMAALWLLVAMSTASWGCYAVAAELFERAPETLPGTLPEMREVSYWVGRMEKPDDVILPLEEIQTRNQRYRDWIRTDNAFEGVPEEHIPIPYFYPGFTMYPPDLNALNAEALADTVHKRLKNEIDYLKSKEWGNYFGIKYAGWEIDEVIDEMGDDAVPASVEPRTAIVVTTSRLRNVPAPFPEKVGVADSGSHRWDRWNIGLLRIGRLVTVLHVSNSGEFVFVQSDIGYGWMSSRNCAFATKEQITSFTEPARFALCTGDRVQYYTSKDCQYSSGWFMMGDSLPLASRINPRLVQVPVRKTNGEMSVDVAWLKVESDVHIGYLPYTRRTIVTQAFKMLGNSYDFTGDLLGRQHETTYRDIFACFGFELPLSDPLFTFYGDDDTVIKPDVGKETQFKAMLAHEPFVTLMSCGRHGQLLLGEYNGEPIVFDMHGYSYKEENGDVLEVKRCNIGTLMMPEYFLERNITFLELK